MLLSFVVLVVIKRLTVTSLQQSKCSIMKQKVYRLLNENKGVIRFIYGLIILNIILIILESYQGFRNKYEQFLWVFEVFSVVVFTVEYILRIWVADIDPRFTGNRIAKRFKFGTSWLGLIDLIAILPFYLPFIFTIDLRMLRILRLFRLLRIFKLGRFSTSLRTINQVLKETKSELAITVFVAFILMVLSSSLMYFIEGDAQPEKFANIGEALWWSVATLTTVGYGDVYPITVAGKILSGIIALVGIGIVALPAGIISSSFIDKIQERKRLSRPAPTHCPYCGEKIP